MAKALFLSLPLHGHTNPSLPQVLTHGGMNSVSESLYYGVPLVVIPQMGEQEVVGRRVAQLGAGLYLAKTAATPATLRESVERVLADGRFREQAAAVRESFQAAGGVRRAADAIQAFTRTVTTARRRTTSSWPSSASTSKERS